jgi:hypothetical protein
MAAWPESQRKAIEERAAETTEKRQRPVIRKLILAFGLVSVLLEHCLLNAKEYDKALQHLLQVADKVIPKGESEGKKPSVQ